MSSLFLQCSLDKFISCFLLFAHMMKKRIDGAKISATKRNETFDVKHQLIKVKFILKKLQIFPDWLKEKNVIPLHLPSLHM